MVGGRRYGKKISPALEKEILAKATEGASSRAIAAWLHTERGVKVSPQAVQRVLKLSSQTRAEVARAVVREKLSKTVISDLDRLGREQTRVEKLTKRLYRVAVRSLDTLERLSGAQPKTQTVDQMIDSMSAKPTVEEIQMAVAVVHDAADAALKATDRATKLAALKLKLSGADPDAGKEPEPVDDDEFRRKVSSLADRLASAREKGAGAPKVLVEGA